MKLFPEHALKAEWRYCPLILSLVEVSCQLHALVIISLGKEPLIRI